jgi:YesN/AraC family two-component response regulator
MPEVDGLQVLDVLRRAEFAGHVIIVSGHPTCMRRHVSGVAKGQGLNVAGHFYKPINTADLARLLKNVETGRLEAN